MAIRDNSKAQPNALPEVIIDLPANVGYVETPFQINLTLSRDPDGEILRTIIMWGDQSQITDMGRPEWASHRYRKAGTYTINVACWDNENAVASGSATIEIVEVIPFEVADLQYLVESPTGQPVPVTLDQIPATTGGTPPIDPPVYDPDDLPADGLFPIGTSLCKFYVEDADGRRAYGEATIAVVDTAPPPEVLAIVPPADEVITTAGKSAVVEWDPATATGGVPPYVFTYHDESGKGVAPGDTFPLGEWAITATVQDAKGARAEGSFLITVEKITPIPPGNNQEYFAARAAHPSTVFAYALTSDAEIAKYRRQAPNAYSPYYDAAMHAMRISIPAGTQGGISNQVWLPITLSEAGQLILIWEEIDGPNWNKDGKFTGWKYFQVRRDADKIWFEIGAGPGGDAPYSLGKGRVRQYSVVGPNTIKGNYQVSDEFGTTNYNTDSIRSAINPPANYVSQRGMPTRHMIVINQDPIDPTYCVFDYYASDPKHALIQIHKGLEITCPDKAGAAGKGRPRHFDWEINSSQPRPSGPEACMWARFMTVHRGVSDPLSLFQSITGW